jgi:hypothetical protein
VCKRGVDFDGAELGPLGRLGRLCRKVVERFTAFEPVASVGSVGSVGSADPQKKMLRDDRGAPFIAYALTYRVNVCALAYRL